MIDTYFDRCDAAQGYRPKAKPISLDDPRQYRGLYFDTTISRNTYAALDCLQQQLDRDVARHKLELSNWDMQTGSFWSAFDSKGWRKK